VTLRRPSRADLIDISQARHLSLTEVELDQYSEAVRRAAHAYEQGGA